MNMAFILKIGPVSGGERTQNAGTLEQRRFRTTVLFFQELTVAETLQNNSLLLIWIYFSLVSYSNCPSYCFWLFQVKVLWMLRHWSRKATCCKKTALFLLKIKLVSIIQNFHCYCFRWKKSKFWDIGEKSPILKIKLKKWPQMCLQKNFLSCAQKLKAPTSPQNNFINSYWSVHTKEMEISKEVLKYFHIFFFSYYDS